MNNVEEESKSGLNFIAVIHFSLISFVVIHLFYFIYILVKQNCRFSQEQPQKPDNLRKINDQCSICLENILNEVQLLCSHSYCANCIIDYFKQRYSSSDVQCPICRAYSKLIFPQFERTEANKELYDYILQYNHETTANYSSTFCFCLDVFRLFQFYLRGLADSRNPRFNRHRKVAIIILLGIFLVVIWPFSDHISNFLELVEDLIFYLSLIFLCAEYFYRRFRSQTNQEFERILSNQSIEENNQSNLDVHNHPEERIEGSNNNQV